MKKKTVEQGCPGDGCTVPCPSCEGNEDIESTRAEKMFARINYKTNFPELVYRTEWPEIQRLIVRVLNSHAGLLKIAHEAIRGKWCPTCGRNNSAYGKICTSDDCPGVQAIAQAEGK